MNQAIYCIYDRVAQVFYTPFFQMNDDHAKRTFISMQADENTPMNTNPMDFDLYHIGYYDSTEGTITGEIFELVVRGAGAEKAETPVNQLKEVANNA